MTIFMLLIQLLKKNKNIFLYFEQTLKIQISYFSVNEHKLNFKIDKYVLLQGAIIPKACN